jgi:hypothetical protein
MGQGKELFLSASMCTVAVKRGTAAPETGNSGMLSLPIPWPEENFFRQRRPRKL